MLHWAPGTSFGSPFSLSIVGFVALTQVVRPALFSPKPSGWPQDFLRECFRTLKVQ